MKKQFIFILLLILPVFFTNCEDEEYEKYFPPEKISELLLDNIESFWGNDTISNISDYVTANFDIDSCHLVSMRYSSNEYKIIAVSVFKTRESAIDAMEERRHSVACIIKDGDSDALEGTWWYTECLGKSIFKNQWNTIIGVRCRQCGFENIDDILYSTVNELDRRIDELSIIME